MPPYATASIDFGYPWWLSYGHLPVLAAAVSILLLGYARKWSRWLMLFAGVVTLWSGAALLVERFVIDVNGRLDLPAQAFLRSGVGRVLDIGAGTGRSSIMVLQSRPQATLVALDLFGESFQQHFGRSETPQQRLIANLKAAEVEQRAVNVTLDAVHQTIALRGRCRFGRGGGGCALKNGGHGRSLVNNKNAAKRRV